jgi:hypothetical protein
MNTSLKSMGYPKLGKVIVNKGDVVVYAYGAHKVLRLFFGKDEYISKDYDLAKHLITHPIDNVARIYRANVIKLGDKKCLAIIMKKYKPGYNGLRINYDNFNYRYTVDTSTYKHEVYWDVHSGNVGVYPKATTKSLVVFDIWGGIGGDGGPSPKYKDRYTVSKRTSKRISAAKERVGAFFRANPLSCDCYSCRMGSLNALNRKDLIEDMKLIDRKRFYV